jgi:hypothetical protein
VSRVGSLKVCYTALAAALCCSCPVARQQVTPCADSLWQEALLLLSHVHAVLCDLTAGKCELRSSPLVTEQAACQHYRPATLHMCQALVAIQRYCQITIQPLGQTEQCAYLASSVGHVTPSVHCDDTVSARRLPSCLKGASKCIASQPTMPWGCSLTQCRAG